MKKACILIFLHLLCFIPKAQDNVLVSTDWLAKNLDKVVVLHVGINRQSYENGHIPEARFLAWSDIVTTKNGIPNELNSVENLQKVFTNLGIGNNKKIILYGDLQGLAAARAFFTLEYLGLSGRVAVLDGGIEKWKAEKRPISTVPVTPNPEEFIIRLNPDIVIGIDQVSDISWLITNRNSSNFSLIDARPPEEYKGERPGEGITRPGHIPGAFNIFWQQNIISRDNPVMKPKEELKKLYAQAGASPNKINVVYCRTGGQASHAYFTLRYLGYNVKLYDGSYFEWQSQKDTKVILGK
ncbi:MAG: sulfurtransferase [Pyrinomonadaceae bacterium]|nr:sulfurtransferase [Pyrinomonadaceae bacterium]MCX7639987.1 sulfurtransferase [Pyrinomonadaceae bacterium]MDW8304159.1 sulfurtransferase [Acidobacteriota bacterium]